MSGQIQTSQTEGEPCSDTSLYKIRELFSGLNIIQVLFLCCRGIRRARTQVHSSHSHGEMNLAVVLVTICVVFLVCHLLRVYLAIQVGPRLFMSELKDAQMSMIKLKANLQRAFFAAWLAHLTTKILFSVNKQPFYTA